MNKYFGTDGIRGAYNDVVTKELAYNVGRALGSLELGAVLVGMDTRESSPALKEQAILGAKEAGLFVHDLNIITTPALIYLTGLYHTLGLMITASHNPYSDNGIKVVKDGHKLNDKEIEILESSLGKTVKVNGSDCFNFSIYDYQKFMRSFNITRNFRVVFDLANGAATYLAKDILPFYGFNNIINNHPDGKNINDNCGSLHLDSLKKQMDFLGADYGFALDGDGDRLMVVDRDLNEYTGDHLVYIFANYLKSKNKLHMNSVVLAQDVNPGVRESLDKKQITSSIAPVGDRNIREQMDQNGSTIGGETSGHVIVLENSPTGDGLMNALFLLEILSETKMTIKELSQGLEFYPILRANLEEFDEKIVDSPKLNEQIAVLKAGISQHYSLVLVRRSGTEHLLRITVSTGDSLKDKEFMKVILENVGGQKK